MSYEQFGVESLPDQKGPPSETQLGLAQLYLQL